jgi:hypothetical protein
VKCQGKGSNQIGEEIPRNHESKYDDACEKGSLISPVQSDPAGYKINQENGHKSVPPMKKLTPKRLCYHYVPVSITQHLNEALKITGPEEIVWGRVLQLEIQNYCKNWEESHEKRAKFLEVPSVASP